MSLYCLFYVTANIYFYLNLNIAGDVVTVLLIFVDTYYFTYGLILARTWKHKYMISAQEKWREPDTGTRAWLKGATVSFVRHRDKGLAHTHTHQKQKNGQHADILNLKRFEQIEFPAKLLDYFLWSNKSNIDQK